MTITLTDSATGEKFEARLAQATPREIDTVLYRLYNEAWDIREARERALTSLRHTVGDKFDYYYKTWTMTRAEVTTKARQQAREATGYAAIHPSEALAKYDALGDALNVNLDTQDPLHGEYNRRPWTRAFLVTDGHVHRSQDCSTCFDTTRFTWLTDLSGKDEAEIVALAGERACTVCYPTAPTLRDFEKASPLFTEEEAQRNADREARATAKVERDAKRIAKALTADGSEFTVVTAEYPTPAHMMRPGRNPITTDRERFKTEQAAIQWVVQQISWGHENSSSSNQYHNRVDEAIAAIVEAYATKHGVTVPEARSVIDAKVVLKAKRDARY